MSPGSLLLSFQQLTLQMLCNGVNDYNTQKFYYAVHSGCRRKITILHTYSDLDAYT